MGSFSIFHWLVVLAIILLLFGTSKVSNLMGEFGKGIKSFKQNVSDDDGKTKDAAMTPPGSLGAPLPEPVKTSSTVNQG